MLVDDHLSVRMGLSQILEAQEDLELVGSASNGEGGVTLAAEQNPDVVLMDLSMPGIGGIEAIRRIVKARPETKVVALTSFAEPADILSVINAGAVGYMLKDAESDELLRGIRAAARGESPLASRAASAVIAAFVERRPTEQLTKREREVLILATTMVNKQIARRLGISEKTVKTHLSNIFQRIGVSDRTQAALWAERHGLLARKD
jgi:DNA-binding NarL/FixJ family response regulator